MKKIILFLLMLLVISPCQATGINVKREATTSKGSMRMPSITRVSADYENGLITVDVKGYTGGVQVFVSDPQGNVVGYTISSVTNNGIVTLNLGSLSEGDYTLNIVLDSATYYGQFDA
ncbi:protein of unknown function [Segatella baroniae B14]|nr:protein of unknown function [Segatella baroniae B14]